MVPLICMATRGGSNETCVSGLVIHCLCSVIAGSTMRAAFDLCGYQDANDVVSPFRRLKITPLPIVLDLDLELVTSVKCHIYVCRYFEVG